MPTYEYVCDACEHAFEHFQSMTDKRLKKCPKCKKLKLSRLIGAGSGIIFKGTGFYETDFKTKKEPAGKKQQSKEGSSKESSKKATKNAPVVS
jgi:putative FmdB family regulatory protein